MDFIFDGNTQQPVFSSESIIMNGDLACIDILIVDDEDAEGNEQFQLEIVDSNLGTIVSPSVTTVIINDDAGIYAHCKLIKSYYDIKMIVLLDVTVNLLGEMIVSEAIGNVDICAMIETEGSLLTQLTVTFTIQGGTASNNIIVHNYYCS